MLFQQKWPTEEKFMSIYPLKISLFGVLCKCHKKKKMQWAELGHVRTQYNQASNT